MRCVADIKYRYWKFIEKEFVRPNLTSNGILGGDKFACATNNFPWDDASAHYQWYDGKLGQNGNGVAHTGGGYSIIYNPNPLKITTVRAEAGYAGDWFDVTFYGSNNGSDWEEIIYLNHGLRTLCEVNSPKFYHYYKIYNKSGFGHDGHGYGGGVAELYINGFEKVVVESTKDDYDFITKEYRCSDLQKNITKYWKNVYTYDNSYLNPILNSNGTPYVSDFAVADTNSASYVWRAFNGVNDNAYTCTGSLYLYFKEPVNIQYLEYVGHADKYSRYRLSKATLLGSNDDGKTWIQVASYSTGNTISGTCNFTSNKQFFNTYKIDQTNTGLGWAIYEAKVKGYIRKLTKVISTKDDYDFTTQEVVHYLMEDKNGV